MTHLLVQYCTRKDVITIAYASITNYTQCFMQTVHEKREFIQGTAQQKRPRELAHLCCCSAIFGSYIQQRGRPRQLDHPCS